MLTPLYLSHDDRDGDSTTRLIGLLFYRRDRSRRARRPRCSRCSGTSGTPRPARPRPRCCRSSRTARARATRSTVVGPVLLAQLHERRLERAASSRSPSSATTPGAATRVVFPLFWHFSQRAGVDDGAVPALLPAPRRARLRHRRDAAASTRATTDGEQLRRPVPAVLALRQRARASRSTHRHAARLLPAATATADERGRRADRPPALLARRPRPLALRAGAAVLALRRPPSRQVDDGRRPLLAPPLGRRDDRRAVPARSTTAAARARAAATRPASPLFPLFHYRRDAETRLFVTPAGRLGARGRHGAGGLRRPLLLVQERATSTPASSRSSTPTSSAAPTASTSRQWGPWFRVEGPGYKAQRALPALRPLRRRAGDATPGSSPRYFRLRRANGDGVDTLPPLFWHSSFGGRTTTVVGPYFDRTTPGAPHLGVVPLFFHATNAERTLTVVPPLLLYQRSSADGTRDWFSCLLFFHDRDPAGTVERAVPVLLVGRRRRTARTDVVFPIFWHFADTAARHALDAGRALLLVARQGTSGRAASCRSPGTRATTPTATPRRRCCRSSTRGTAATTSRSTRCSAGYHRRGPSHFWYAGPVLHTDSPTSSFSMFAPLWFSHTQQGDRDDDHGHPAAAARLAQQPGDGALEHAAAVLALPRHRHLDLRSGCRSTTTSTSTTSRARRCCCRSSSATRTRSTHDDLLGRPAAALLPPLDADRRHDGRRSRWSGTSSAAHDRTTVVFPFYFRSAERRPRRDLRLPELLPQRGPRPPTAAPTAPTAATSSRSTTRA